MTMQKVNHRPTDAKQLSSVASLTILGALIGANANQLPKNLDTAIIIIIAVIVLATFHGMLSWLDHSFSNDALPRKIMMLAACLFWIMFAGWICSSLVTNPFVPVAVFAGWLVSYLMLRPPSSMTVGETDND
ncbi:MAG: hypothetical protein WA908_08880 [Pontixanthobacter sp.]